MIPPNVIIWDNRWCSFAKNQIASIGEFQQDILFSDLLGSSNTMNLVVLFSIIIPADLQIMSTYTKSSQGKVYVSGIVTLREALRKL